MHEQVRSRISELPNACHMRHVLSTVTVLPLSGPRAAGQWPSGTTALVSPDGPDSFNQQFIAGCMETWGPKTPQPWIPDASAWLQTTRLPGPALSRARVVIDCSSADELTHPEQYGTSHVFQ
jgi:hypothetical protein